MKKLISLLSVALLATSVFAIPATAKKMAVTMTPQEKIQISQSPENLEAQAVKTAIAPQQMVDLEDALAPKAHIARAMQAAKPTAFYYKPAGTFFGGIFNDPKYYSYVFTMLRPTVVGANLNGYEFWSWQNHASNAAALAYKTILTPYGQKERGWSMDPATGNFQDSLPAQYFGNLRYLYSWRVPAQFAYNADASVVDTFFLLGPKSTRPDTLVTEAASVGGIFNPYNTVDGMWPLTNALASTPKFGNKLGVVWDTWEDKEAKQHVSYVYGTEPVLLLSKVDTIWDETTTPPTIIKLDSIYDTIQPSALMASYEKPMAPLYVKSVSLALTALDLETKKLGDIQIDSLQMLIVSSKTSAVLASSIATKLDTASMDAYPGQLLTFKIEKKDPYGTVIEGVTINEPFMVVINGLAREGNSFGVWSGLDPYTGGRQVAVLDTNKQIRSYAPFNPFIMLNGIFYTLEHAARTPGFMGDEPEYVDTVNVAVLADTENDMYIAVHADGSFKNHLPLLRSTELLYDTISKSYNYNIYDAPDWVQLDMDYEDYPYPGEPKAGVNWWTEFQAYYLYIYGDLSDTSVDAPQVGDEFKLVGYGQQIVFKVVEVEDPTAINNVVRTVNDGKLYNVLGIEVDEDYKGVVIRNGQKFLK